MHLRFKKSYLQRLIPWMVIATQAPFGLWSCRSKSLVSGKDTVSRRNGIKSDCPSPSPGSSPVPGCEPFKIASVTPLVIGAGEAVTLTGENFRPSMSLGSAENGIKGLNVVSGSQATIEASKEISFGARELLLTQDGVEQKVTIVLTDGRNNYPIITANKDEVCNSVSFYDAKGDLQKGTKNCLDVPECASDGATNCVATTKFAAASTLSLADKVLAGSSVAGVAGNVVLPATGKVLSGTPFGSVGTSLTGALILPLAANILKGSPSYGDPGGLFVPSYQPTFPEILVRPVAPTITSASFNFNPQRVTLTWSSVSDAEGYVVVMRAGAPIAWTPTDGVTYATDLASNDKIIYVGDATTVMYETPVNAGTNYFFAVYSYQEDKIYSKTAAMKQVLSCAGLVGGIWTAVPGDSKYGTSGFCVQKYVPSNVAGVPTSQAGSLPWVNLTQNAARSQCSGLGTGYHLITVGEWMTIATNVASTNANWSGGSVGAGSLPNGHSDSNPPSACAADANDNNAWVEGTCTGQPRGALAFTQRRTQYLSNDNVIWDFGGNVYQWVDFVNGTDKPLPATSTWNEYPTVTGTTTMPKSYLVPSSCRISRIVHHPNFHDAPPRFPSCTSWISSIVHHPNFLDSAPRKS